MKPSIFDTPISRRTVNKAIGGTIVTPLIPSSPLLEKALGVMPAIVSGDPGAFLQMQALTDFQTHHDGQQSATARANALFQAGRELLAGANADLGSAGELLPTADHNLRLKSIIADTVGQLATEHDTYLGHVVSGLQNLCKVVALNTPGAPSGGRGAVVQQDGRTLWLADRPASSDTAGGLDSWAQQHFRDMAGSLLNSKPGRGKLYEMAKGLPADSPARKVFLDLLTQPDSAPLSGAARRMFGAAKPTLGSLRGALKTHAATWERGVFDWKARSALHYDLDGRQYVEPDASSAQAESKPAEADIDAALERWKKVTQLEWRRLDSAVGPIYIANTEAPIRRGMSVEVPAYHPAYEMAAWVNDVALSRGEFMSDLATLEATRDDKKASIRLRVPARLFEDEAYPERIRHERLENPERRQRIGKWKDREYEKAVDARLTEQGYDKAAESERRRAWHARRQGQNASEPSR